MSEQGTSVRHGVSWGVVAFSAALAVVVGLRLDQAALTLIVGVACGVMASIPTGLLVVYVLRRRDGGSERRAAREYYDRGLRQAPPVVVVSPPAAPQLPQSIGWPVGQMSAVPSQRQFAVIGQEGASDEFDKW
jgi:hypothetical protein